MEEGMDQTQPLVSIVVPVYNAAEYLRECVDSLLGQTYRNVEVICVDDGSTDESASILEEYARRDGRVRVVKQENAGPGVARNRGIDEAHGAYLYCFDSDDTCDAALIEKAVERIERTSSDIVVFAFEQYRQHEGFARRPWWALMPDRFSGDAVSWRDNPDWIFRAFQNYPWNKMLRMSFVRQNNLRYQDLHLTEDLMFSAPALVLAERIAWIDEVLVTHREGTGKNVMANKDAHPLDFLTAFLTLRDFLERQGLYEKLRVAYLNWVVDGCAYNLNTLRTYEGFELVFTTLRESGLRDLGVLDADLSVFQESWYRDFVSDVMGVSPGEYLHRLYAHAREERDDFDFRSAKIWTEGERYRAWAHSEIERRQEACDALRAELEGVRSQLRKTQEELQSVLGSAEQRVGQAVCRVPRAVQRTVRSRKSAK